MSSVPGCIRCGRVAARYLTWCNDHWWMLATAARQAARERFRDAHGHAAVQAELAAELDSIPNWKRAAAHRG